MFFASLYAVTNAIASAPPCEAAPSKRNAYAFSARRAVCVSFTSYVGSCLDSSLHVTTHASSSRVTPLAYCSVNAFTTAFRANVGVELKGVS
eukprot:13258-Pelagococcus_subviridis.AAC.1